MDPTIRMAAAATAPEGGINLAPYPALTYAPAQHGEGIRFAHNGVRVEESAAEPGREAARLVDALATSLGVPFGDVLDGLKFLRAAGRI